MKFFIAASTSRCLKCYCYCYYHSDYQILITSRNKVLSKNHIDSAKQQNHSHHQAITCSLVIGKKCDAGSCQKTLSFTKTKIVTITTPTCIAIIIITIHPVFCQYQQGIIFIVMTIFLSSLPFVRLLPFLVGLSMLVPLLRLLRLLLLSLLFFFILIRCALAWSVLMLWFELKLSRGVS